MSCGVCKQCSSRYGWHRCRHCPVCVSLECPQTGHQMSVSRLAHTGIHRRAGQAGSSTFWAARWHLAAQGIRPLSGFQHLCQRAHAAPQHSCSCAAGGWSAQSTQSERKIQNVCGKKGSPLKWWKDMMEPSCMGCNVCCRVTMMCGGKLYTENSE